MELSTVETAAVETAVRGYAGRLHAAIGDGHHVASPLGAWLVLALAAPAARGATAERLADVLGMPVPAAAAAARELLERPHEAVAAAAAAWTSGGPDRLSGDAAAWVAGLPAAVERGPVPNQADADAWARERTFGLIERFPIDMAVPWDCVLASALATRVRWRSPFAVAAPSEFRSPWRERVTEVLRSRRHGHRCMIVQHAEAGDLAVHRVEADGLTVTSVIAAPEVAPARVLDAAHDAAAGRVPAVSLFDLPLGDGPSWTVTESDGDDGAERLTALLPAWSARSEHDLRAPELGFADAAATLCRLFGADDWDAKQAAMARFDREGFEAAAVTALGVAASLHLRRPGRQREALLRFDRPYAVVATATATSRGGSAWSGLPVFSAWVAEPGLDRQLGEHSGTAPPAQHHLPHTAGVEPDAGQLPTAELRLDREPHRRGHA